MKNLFIVLFAEIKVLSYFILGGIFVITLFVLLQLISYRIFKFNLYKWLCYNLIDKYM